MVYKQLNIFNCLSYYVIAENIFSVHLHDNSGEHYISICEAKAKK